MTDTFDDAAAFRRNLGWITEIEQSLLRGGPVDPSDLGGTHEEKTMTLSVRLSAALEQKLTAYCAAHPLSHDERPYKNPLSLWERGWG